MARIRSIKPEFFTSDQVVCCSRSARLLFIGLWCFSDDAGRHPASAKRIKMEVFPGDQFNTKQIDALITELIDNELVCEYESQGVPYWQITKWKKHQRIDKPTVRHPSPLDEHSTITRGVFGDTSPPEWSGVEGKGIGVEGNGEKEDRAKHKKSRVRFTPPSLEEVRAYCRQRRKGVDPELWINHYISNDWMVGKVPMKDWKAAMRTWESNKFGDKKPTDAARPFDPNATPKSVKNTW